MLQRAKKCYRNRSIVTSTITRQQQRQSTVVEQQQQQQQKSLPCFFGNNNTIDDSCIVRRKLRNRVVNNFLTKSNNGRYYNHHHYYSTTSIVHKSTLLSSDQNENNDDDDARYYYNSSNNVLDRDIDRFTQSSMLQFLPQSSFVSIQQQQQQQQQQELMSKATIMQTSAENEASMNGSYEDTSLSYDNDSIFEEDIIEEEYIGKKEMMDVTTASDIDLQSQQQQQGLHPKRHHHQEEPVKVYHKNMPLIELLQKFNPENPPNIQDYPTRELGLEAIQCWLECDSLEESVAKFQRVIDNARNRSDYNQLSFVERQIAKWFVPLQEAIEAKRIAYITKENNNNDSDSLSNPKREKTSPGTTIFGPLLCSLPSAKLAIITAHQAIIQCAIHSTNSSSSSSHSKEHHTSGYHRHQYSATGAQYVKLACAIGQCIEDELIIHKILHKRALEEAHQSKANKSSNISSNPKNANATDDNNNEESENSVNNNDDSFESNVSALFMRDDEKDAVMSSSLLNATDDIKDLTQSSNVTHKWTYTTTHLKEYLDEISKYKPNEKKRRVIRNALNKARSAIDRADSWTQMEKAQLGSALLKILIETVTIDGSNNEPAFNLELRWLNGTQCQSYVTMDDMLLKMIAVDDLDTLTATATRHRPMIVPPRPWTAAKAGGYLVLETDIMRYHGCTTQKEAICNAESSVVFDGLNALSRVKWVINQRLLEVAQRCWNENIPLGDIPSRTDYEMPEEPTPPEWSGVKYVKGTDEYNAALAELVKYSDRMVKYNRIKQKNADLVSLRCSAMLKLNQADKFKDFDEIYFPYNMDFRGRAYPIPPHFSNVGSDLCRGMLLFAEAKPLGERGLFWLKVHLANLAGKDKMTFDDRASFVDENLDKVRESASDPFGGERWWMTLENPFQALATCYEIVDAIDSGDPASYMCSLAVHMDGSCNGLQHYAALGRDYNGGKAVNLCVTDLPQDVYIGVMHEVIRRVSEEASRTFDYDTSKPESLTAAQRQELKNNRAAKLVDGLIDRGVVKRTVMTSVYGVTYVGARTQIQEKVEQKLAQVGHDLDEIDYEVFNACSYLAHVTLEVIGDLFSGAKSTMNWLTTCARLITQHGYPVAWISPIGLPAVQPYRQKKTAKIVTLTQTISLNIVNDDLPIHKSRQVSAFPPNYIHSLDSSHMLLTALEMDRRGLTFSAVHDSFWTHPCDVDEMNCALRDTFVELYSQPLLERLKETWELRYPELNFPDLPERGTLVLSDVKQAKYFFQ